LDIYSLCAYDMCVKPNNRFNLTPRPVMVRAR